jgi:nitroreductase
MRKIQLGVTSLCLLALLATATVAAQDLKPVQLPAPRTEGGKPLLPAMRDRQSTREFAPEKLPMQVLSDLLWAAAGINRPTGGRTAPGTTGAIDVYVATDEAVYLYDAKGNTLQPVVAGDLRALTGRQAFVRDAPLNLVYVANMELVPGDAGDGKLFSLAPEAADAKSDSVVPYESAKLFTAAGDAATAGENVYLFCASEGLATVLRGAVDRPPLAKALNLRADQRITWAQSVGYPKK